MGTMLYQIKYAPMIQKYTSGWPKYQNSMRVIMTLMVGTQFRDHGIKKNNISIATPMVAIVHMMNVQAAPWTTSGSLAPGCVRLKYATFSRISASTNQVATTSSVAPM